MSVNKLILGDNLEIMEKMESETVDLIYLDPPFFSNRDYEMGLEGTDKLKLNMEEINK
jgi:DNA modification methylase